MKIRSSLITNLLMSLLLLAACGTASAQLKQRFPEMQPQGPRREIYTSRVPQSLRDVIANRRQNAGVDVRKVWRKK